MKPQLRRDIMKKPLIGIVASFYVNRDNEPLSTQSVSRDYVRGIIKAGGMPMIIPVQEKSPMFDNYEEMMDGLLLTGGGDITPSVYGAEKHEKTGFTDLNKDVLEIELTRKMMEAGKPVFGICRGFQVINVALGGTMYQDILTSGKGWHNHAGEMAFRSRPLHSIKIDRDTRMFRVFGKEEIEVNSFHHQALDRIGEGLKITAVSDDGIPEALEHENGKVWGVEFHPENMFDAYPEFLGLFRSFVEDCER